MQDGSLFLRINRGGSLDWIPPAPSTPVVTQAFNGEPDSLATTSPDTFVDTDTNVDTSVVVADKDTPGSEVSSTPTPDNTNETQVGAGAFGWVYLLLLGGFLPLQRRVTPVN